MQVRHPQPPIPPRFRFLTPLLVLSLGLSMALLSSCRRQQKPERISIEKLKVEMVPELEVNRLDRIDSAVYRAYAGSPIHWQPWEPGILEWSDATKKLIFCVIARPQHPNFFEVMRELERNSQIVDTINDHYIPVLIDGDIATEQALLATMLSAEINRDISFPLFLWMDRNAHPVACTPVSPDTPGGVAQVFDQSHAMIAPMWKEDLEKWLANGSLGYVIENSQHDHQKRLTRMASLLSERRFSQDQPAVLAAAVRQLTSQYDPYSKSFAGAGDVLPTAEIRLLAKAAMCEGFDSALRDRSRGVVKRMLGHLISSPMIDPLDGGVFSMRSGEGWSLPRFSRDCVGQAEFAQALLLGHQAAGVEGANAAAMRLIIHLEQGCATKDGLFALNPSLDTDPEKWMWTTDEVGRILGDDAAWWTRMTGMKVIGNLPLEVDPTRKHFRKNSLSQAVAVDELAASLSVPLDEFRDKVEKARTRLLAARSMRLRGDFRDRSPHLASSLAMVSLYVTAHQVTGDVRWKDKALGLHQALREHFVKDGVLLPMGAPHAPCFAAARARHHAQAALTALELHGIAGDQVPAREIIEFHLAALARDHLRDGLLHELCPQHQLLQVPIEDSAMTFGMSTLGMLAILDSRLSSLGAKTPDTLLPLFQRLPLVAAGNPALHADLLEAALNRRFARAE